jgi:DNA invertase Pin-like site-specific DNA recombinase
MKVGYARVSSFGQSLDVQLEKLKDCDKIFHEKQSGTTDKRVELQNCLDFVRDGDVLVITKLDRLARNTRDLLNIVNNLESKNVMLKILDQNVGTDTASGKLMFTLLGAIAEFENDLRKSRQRDGIELSKQRGVKFGRKIKLSNDQIIEMKHKRDSGTLIKDLMTEYSLSKSSVYRLMNSLNDQEMIENQDTLLISYSNTEEQSDHIV